MHNFFASLAPQLQSQFVTGGLILMVTGSALALARQTPVRLGRWLIRRFTLDVEIRNSDPLFDYMTLWLNQHPYAQRSRSLTASSINCAGPDVPSDGARQRVRVFLTPAPGSHCFFYGQHPIWLRRWRDDQKPGGGEGKQASLLSRESYSLTMLGRKQNTIRKLIEEIVALGSTPDAVSLYSSSFGYWRSGGMFNPRKIDSVILPAGVAEHLVSDAKQFLAAGEFYRSVGVPWHRGYLLHGLPGSGKSSIVAELAGELHMDLFLLSMGGFGMDDERLRDLMSQVRSRTMVLMEDVDCTSPSRERPSGAKGVTLSGLLNCLDGIQSTEGCMIFMTTNFREALDPALIRPGRVDVSIEFGIATRDQVLRLRERLAPDYDADLLEERAEGMTMAGVQQLLLDHRSNKAVAFIAAA